MAVVTRRREELHLPQREIARRLNRPIAFTHVIETGERMLSLYELPAYAAALEMDPCELFGEILSVTEAEKAALSSSGKRAIERFVVTAEKRGRGRR